MEYWDIYDYYGNKKDKSAIRGSKLNDDDYHLVVNAWIMNSKGEFLITQRTATKSHPLKWECTGGSALKGESALKAAKREIQEELGIELEDKDAKLIGITRRFYKDCPDILSVFLFKKDISLEEINIQKSEVNDVMWASKDKILNLLKENKFEANSLFYKVINLNEHQSFYYLGFNANNAIGNEDFFKGMVTLNPNNTKGNIFFTKAIINNKDDEFFSNYKTYLLNTMERLVRKNKNTIFLAFNKKIKCLLSDVNKYSIIGEKDYDLINKLNDKKYIRSIFKNTIPVINTKWIDKKIDYETAKKNNRIQCICNTGQDRLWR
ncbi:MAG: NUDIX domain-containing protein [Bacilli bacterium]